MKLLPFEEGRNILDTSPCPRCAGSGKYAHPAPRLPTDCMNCRGLGRKPTSDALRLFYEICELLGKPMMPELRESRLEPKHLETIFGRDVTEGMRVRVVAGGGDRDWHQVVTRIERLTLEQKRLHFADGSVKVVSEYAWLDRELTQEEIRRVQALMASKVGSGSIDMAMPTRSLQRVVATFRPSRTDDLVEGSAEWIGWRGVWESGWIIDESEEVNGDWAMLPRSAIEGESRGLPPFAWAPWRDLVDVEVHP